jgi:hypothetical protein
MDLSTDFVCMVSASYNDNYYEIDFNGQLVFTNFPETDSNYKGFYG